jgi:hypothetical protein
MKLGSNPTIAYGISRAQCDAQGGMSAPNKDMFGREISVTCTIPPKAAPAPVTNIQTTISPNTQTQVSPQISPVFQQQFQPNQSPMTGATQQQAPSAQTGGGVAPSSGISESQLQAALQRQAQEYAAAQAAREERAMAIQAQMIEAIRAQPLAPAYQPAPTSAPVYAPPISAPAPVYNPDNATGGGGGIPSVEDIYGPQAAPVKTEKNYLPWLIGGGGILAVMMMQRKKVRQ